jgi:hypothetical protein
MIALTGLLVGCGSSDLAQVASSEEALNAAPSAAALAALELPGCEELARLAPVPTGRWQIFAHPASPDLAVLTRDGCPLCIDTPRRASEELGKLHVLAGIETPALISTPIDDDPVPIRSEEKNGEQGDQGGEDPSGEQSPPAAGENGGVSNPQLASTPMPSDDPVPIRGLSAGLKLIGSATASSKN